MKDIFTDIFHSNTWGSSVSRSGPGSTPDRAKTVGKELLGIVERRNIRALLDAPCGDFLWMNEVSLPLRSYTGVDIVEELIDENRRRYENESRRFLLGDISRDALPAADLILCRDCLVHFSYEDIFRTFENFRRSGSRYVLATTFAARSRNENIVTGGWRPLNLMRAPFCLPRPLELVPDWCPQPEYTDKSLGLWPVESLPVPAGARGASRS